MPADALESFTQRMPEARISLTEDAQSIALDKPRSGALDFIVTNTPADDPPDEFVQHPLFVMQLAQYKGKAERRSRG